MYIILHKPTSLFPKANNTQQMDSLDNPRIYFFSICVLLYYQVVNLLTINVIIIVVHEEYLIQCPQLGRSLKQSQQTFFPNHSFKLIVNNFVFQRFAKQRTKYMGTARSARCDNKAHFGFNFYGHGKLCLHSAFTTRWIKKYIMPLFLISCCKNGKGSQFEFVKS